MRWFSKKGKDTKLDLHSKIVPLRRGRMHETLAEELPVMKKRKIDYESSKRDSGNLNEGKKPRRSSRKK